MTNFEKVAEFMKCGDQEVKKSPEFPAEAVQQLRLKLIFEEVDELVDASEDKDIVEIADALTDILYVVYGMGHAYGIDLDRCFKEVHRSNMTKVVEGKLMRNEAGKVLKPDTYEPPNLQGVLFS